MDSHDGFAGLPVVPDALYRLSLGLPVEPGMLWEALVGLSRVGDEVLEAVRDRGVVECHLHV